MDKITINEFSQGEAKEISELVEAVFDEFVAPCYSAAAVENFRASVNPETLAARAKSGGELILTARAGERAAGVISMTKKGEITLLFVGKKFHGRGIARRLLGAAVEKCRKNDPKLAEIKVNSSLFGVYIFQQMNFTLLGPEQEENGAKFFPMSMKL